MKSILENLLRSLVVGMGYTASLVFTHLLTSRAVDTTSLFWSFVGGTVIGLTLGVLAASMPAPWVRHMLVWGSVIFFNIASVTIEGRFFAPDLVQGSMIVLILQQLLVALITTSLIVKIFAPIEHTALTTLPQRSWFSWIWRFAVSGLSYMVLYYFFGAINYLLVTGPYYETQAGGLVVPAPDVILKAELVRAPMIVLSVVPFLLTFRASKRRRDFLTGLILFVVGGVAPLLMQVSTLPLILLAASTIEIFFQNYLTGVVTARLLGKDR